MRKRISATILLIVTAIIYWWLSWMFSLSWNLHFGATWLHFAVISLVIAGSVALLCHGSKSEKVGKCSDRLFLVPIILVVGVAIVSIAQSTVFSASKYYKYVSERVSVVTEEEKVSAFPDFVESEENTGDLSIYGAAEALKKAEMEMGKYPDLSGKFKIRWTDVTSQNINGKLCYVIPLQPKSPSTWNKEEGSHGYFVIERNGGAVTFVEDRLKYTTKAPYNSNVYRKFREFDRHSGITDATPEVDEDGVFHYVATTYEQDCVGAIRKVTGILDMNVNTGEIKKYGMDEIPAFVDRVYPEEFFEEYIGYYGKFKNGFMNSLFGQKEVQEQTEDQAVMYKDGVCYYYTGWTSFGMHESSNGIMMMNARTGEMKLYQSNGIAENTALAAAQEKVQEKAYTVGYPELLKVAEEETYVSTMRDVYNNLVGYAFVSYKDHTKMAVGDTLKEAKELYVEALEKASSSEVVEEGVVNEVTGNIAAISSEVLDGTTIYYVQLEGSNQIFSLCSRLEPKIVFAKQGDVITIKYYPVESDAIAATGVKLQ